MSKEFTFTIKSICFDENYRPADNTRITTNFANLARGMSREENLRNTLRMIDNRFNALAHWDNPKGDRYGVELEIISVEMNIDAENRTSGLPLIEILKTNIVDKKTNERIEGIVGNNFSSYVRDYDFSVLLLDHNKTSLRLARQKSLVNCTATCLRALLTLRLIKPTLKGTCDLLKRFNK